MNSNFKLSLTALCASMLAYASAVFAPLTHAAQADIATTPLASTRSAQVKPNIMLLMDTSGSMAFTHMPDEVEVQTKPTSVGYKSWQCNSLYFKPSGTYTPPPKGDGSFFPNAAFTSARYDAFDTGSTVVTDLSSKFRAYETGNESGATYDPTRRTVIRNTWPIDTVGAAYYYVHSSGSKLDYASAPCTDADTFATDGQVSKPASGGGTWTRVTVAAGQQANFANWYSYYRTRMLLTKNAASSSFNPLNNSYRIGFITVDPTVGAATAGQVNADKFLAINDFSPGAGAQREKWFSKLFAQKPAGASPAREGLARVGRYFGNKFDGINTGMGGVDPMQYSCQKNFTIMTTDGYWNAHTETKSSDLSGGFIGGPVDLGGRNWVADATSKLNPDGTLTAATGFVPYGVWDGFADALKTETDWQDTFVDRVCTQTNATIINSSQAVASTQSFSTSTIQTSKTTQQFTEAQTNYTTARDKFETRTQQYQVATDQYTTQTLTQTKTTVQLTKTSTPFTKVVTTAYTTQKIQLVESKSQTSQTDTAYTKQVLTGYTIEKLQTYAKTSKTTKTTTQYKRGKTQTFKQRYQTLRNGGSDGGSTAVQTCIAGPGVVCEKQIVSSWTPSACTVDSSGTAPNYVKTECRTDILEDVAAVVACSPGTSTDASFVTTTCTLTTLSGPTAVAASNCTPGIDGSLVNTICDVVVINAGQAVQTCTAGTNGSFVTTECMPGPLTVNATPSAACSSSGASSPNWVTTNCVKTGPTTSYVPPSTCFSQTATSTNGGQTIACTPGAVTNVGFVASCTDAALVGSGSSSKQVVCNRGLNPSSGYVASCKYGSSPFTEGSPNYWVYVCGDNGPSSQAQGPSATCTAGTTTAANQVKTICAVTGPTTTYVADSASCFAQTASSANGGATVTCTTPVASTIDVGSCTQGTTGSGSSQATVSCGSRPLTSGTTNICNPNTTVGGVVTSCAVAVGPIVPINPSPGCTPGDTYNATPPYAGVRCSRAQNSGFVGSVCSPGITPASSPLWKKSTCSIQNQTAFTALETCAVGTTFSVGPAFVATTCRDTVLSPTSALNGSCTVGTAFSGGATTTCGVSVVVNAGTPSSTCTAAGATRLSTPPYTEKVCTSNGGTSYVDPAIGCVDAAKSPSNLYTSTVCSTPAAVVAASPPCNVGTSNTGSPDWKSVTCTVGAPSVEVPENCTPGVTFDPATGITKTCRAIVASNPGVCTPGITTAPSALNNWTTATCSVGAAEGTKRSYSRIQTVTKTNFSGGIAVGTPAVTTTQLTASTDVDGVCHVPGINPDTPLPPSTRPTTGMPSGCGAWPCSTTVALSGGSYQSLADVAQYYYTTDLRPDFSNTGDQGVQATGTGALDDTNPAQHMTTFTVALGVSGTLNYNSNYKKSGSGDFADIVAGTKRWPAWPDSTLDYNSGSGFTLWDDRRSIDDFWHTAVNGRGQYFSAGEPKALASGVAGALAKIGEVLSAGAAAGTSTLEPVVGDNFAFFGSYTTESWTGDVIGTTLDTGTGDPSTAILWSAQKQLDLKRGAACDNRNIYLIRSGSPLTDNLVKFSWNSKKCDAAGLPIDSTANTGLDNTEKLSFDSSKVTSFSHYPAMTDGTNGQPNQQAAAAGENLVNFVRGQTKFEGFEAGDANKLYRSRAHALGDVIGGQPVYVKSPRAEYQDGGYQAFKTANASRTPMVYVAANDGMLHAFNVGTGATDPLGGDESWAIIPSAVLPNLYKLADDNYANLHQFSVDGTPTVGDVRGSTAGSWKTMLVGGLNAGGKGYYALDITNPATPKAMWEFKFSTSCYDGSPASAGSDCNLGLTFGKPIITKIIDPGYAEGRWVVMVTSGYNNVDATAGDGLGYLYVLDALTGQIVHRLGTGVGSTGTPSNLGQINTYVDDGSINNTALRVYGADMLGNVWRFDVNDTQAPAGREATLLGTAKDSGGAAQPITVRPELAELGGKPMVFVATGRLLGTTDVANTQSQSIYGIVDTLTGSPVHSDLRTVLKPMALTSTGGTPAARTIACASADARCASTKGWVVNLPDSGERVNIDMKLALSTLIVGSNVPNNTACSTGGYSWLNYLDFATGESNGSFGGTPATGSTAATGYGAQASQYSSGSLLVGIGVVRLPSGDFKTLLRTSGSEGTKPITGFIKRDLFPPTPAPKGKRISWREIPQK
jgi:Tfp pilus tip-associated adhesin PilY1